MIDKERLLKLTQDVIRINSENPPGNEKALGTFVARQMRSLGCDVQQYVYDRDRPNVVATLKGSLPRHRAAKQAILLTPHIDTVPIGQHWRFDPLGGKIEKGRIYGRGASDDKGNLACCIEAVQSLVEDGIRLQRDVVVAATADEETGSHYGIIPLLEKKIVQPEAAVIVDAFDFDTVVAQKGLIHCRVQIFGKKAHGAYKWQGVNSIEMAAALVNRLQRWRLPVKKHPLLHPPTVNVGCIRGGDKVNMVPDFCEVALDIRFLPGCDSRLILKDLKAFVRQECRKFKVVVDDCQQPYEMDPEHPLVASFLSTARRMRLPAVLRGSEGATVITFFKKHRIPAFATGFGASGTAHTTDEFARTKTLYDGARLLEQFLKDYDQHA